MSDKNLRTLITGASSGIGYAFAKIFASHGHDLILTARSVDKLQKLKEEIETTSKVAVEIILADLSEPDGPAQLVKSVHQQKLSVDILVNNAGFGLQGDFARETEWKKEKDMIQVNVAALTELCKAFLPEMVARKHGKILNLASTAAFQAGPLAAVYFASKAYVLHFSEAIAEEVSGTGVTVTALCPGPTQSEFTKNAGMENSRLFKDRKIPTSEEVAKFGYEKLMKNERVAIHGLKNYIMAQSNRVVPRKIVASVTKKFQEQKS